MKIFIVTATSGEWEDRTKTDLIAFTTNELAENYINEIETKKRKRDKELSKQMPKLRKELDKLEDKGYGALTDEEEKRLHDLDKLIDEYDYGDGYSFFINELELEK